MAQTNGKLNNIRKQGFEKTNVELCLMYKRENTKQIQIGKVAVGHGAPVLVQSMTKTLTQDIEATIAQINELAFSGCEIIRCAVPDMQAAQALKEICLRSPIPVVADIHFDYRLALEAAKYVQGLRINPGNIGNEERVKAVVETAREYCLPIRIGVNSGSLPQNLDRSHPLEEQLVEAALREIERLHKFDFDNIKISVKAFDVPATMQAYLALAQKVPYPLHVGITEAGTGYSGLVRSSVGIGAILSQGIGDTIRVSLATSPIEEVRAGWEILKSLNLRQRGVSIIACPTCGRAQAEIKNLALQVEEAFKTIDKPLKVAVMGCSVNGPGEAAAADLGIACGEDKGLLFVRGQKIAVVAETDYIKALLEQALLL